MKRLLYLAVLVILATLAFSSVATAQSAYAPPDSTVDCSAAEEGQPPGIEFFFLPDAGGCIAVGSEGVVSSPIIVDLNKVVFDSDTGERLGVAKGLDPDLSSGSNSVTYQEFCAAWDTIPDEVETPQSYFEQAANAKEQAILDPDGDGLACTAEDEAFVAGDTGANGIDGGQQDQYANQTDGGDDQQADDQPAEQPQPDGQMDELPDTGGPVLSLPVVGLLLCSGLLGLLAAVWRRV